MDQVNEFVLENRRMTMQDIPNMFELSFVSVQSMLKDNMNMWEQCYQICALYVLSVHEFLAKNKMFFHSTPFDFFLFPKLRIV